MCQVPKGYYLRKKKRPHSVGTYSRVETFLSQQLDVKSFQHPSQKRYWTIPSRYLSTDFWYLQLYDIASEHLLHIPEHMIGFILTNAFFFLGRFQDVTQTNLVQFSHDDTVHYAAESVPIRSLMYLDWPAVPGHSRCILPGIISNDSSDLRSATNEQSENVTTDRSIYNHDNSDCNNVA